MFKKMFAMFFLCVNCGETAYVFVENICAERQSVKLLLIIRLLLHDLIFFNLHHHHPKDLSDHRMLLTK